jgi:hypothetical protein
MNRLKKRDNFKLVNSKYGNTPIKFKLFVFSDMSMNFGWMSNITVIKMVLNRIMSSKKEKYRILTQPYF